MDSGKIMDIRNTDISNILIIGCGGSGLRAAIEAKNNNLSVKILGKRNKNDSHTTLAAGGINAALGNLDEEEEECYEDEEVGCEEDVEGMEVEEEEEEMEEEVADEELVFV